MQDPNAFQLSPIETSHSEDPNDAASRRSSHWKGVLSFSNSNRPTRPLSDYEVLLLRLCSGDTTSKVTPEWTAYMRFLSLIVSGKWVEEWDTVFHQDFLLSEEPCAKAIAFCCQVAQVIRDHGGISIARIENKLQSKRVIRDDSGLQNKMMLHQLIFGAIGWISTLYTPADLSDSSDLSIIRHATGAGMHTSVTADMVSRPLDEILRSFGDIVPLPVSSGALQSAEVAQFEEPSIKFEVSHLNVSTLKAMAGIRIIWVDSLGEHLTFDSTVPSLCIFRFPSFCHMQQADKSILAILLREFYGANETEAAISYRGFLKEILLSYTLLFKADRRSRSIYQTSERTRASLVQADGEILLDPGLDDLCGYNISGFFNFGLTIRDSFDSLADFPILKDRIRKIQDYIKDIQPNGFLSLWRDRRDMRLWYTIWAVIILSVIGLVIAIVSMILAGVQVQIARLAYELQLKQGG